MLTFGLRPFFAGAKVLIICEIRKFLSFFLIIKGQFFHSTALFCRKSLIFILFFAHLVRGEQASANHSVISSSRYGERLLKTVA